VLPGSCGDNATYQLTEADQSEEAEALTEEVQRELTLPSNTDDVTVECVATSQSGVSRVTYVSCKALGNIEYNKAHMLG